MATEKPRFSITVPDSMLDDIVNFQNANNFATRSRAIQQLIRLGIDDLTKERTTKNSPALSSEALRVAKDYDALDPHGQRVVRVVLDEELARMAEKTAPEPDIVPAEKEIPLFGAFFAAGAAEPDFGNPPEKVRVPASSPAQFAIRINGTSMQPWLMDQSIALGVSRMPRDGEVCAVLYDGKFLVKQILRDHLGNVFLLSLNRKESAQDVTLWASQLEDAQLTVFGTILMEEKVPLPQI